MSNIKTKQTLYGIFNEIQTRTDTKENLQSLYELFEATPIQEFNECLENVFLIIFYNYEKNTLLPCRRLPRGILAQNKRRNNS